MASVHAAETGIEAGRDRTALLADLTGGFAHDFNNLLTVIRGAAELAHREAPETPHLAEIIGAADRAARLTGQLLAFAGRLPLRPSAVALQPLFAELKASLESPRLRVRVMVTTGLPPVHADAASLADALRAAAQNAVEAMPDGGVLTFGAALADDGRAIRITVADSGCGMSAEVQARACEPFFTTKPVGAGSGLGLAQISGFARQSGGSLRIESAPGSGTTLMLLMPVATGAEVAAVPTSVANAPAAGTRVLLVEDSNTVAAFAEALLGDLGCQVTRAACAAEALDHLRAGAFDIMFSDIVMPGMSGIDLAHEVRRDHPRLPILLATGHSEQAARDGSRFPILAKPYRRDTLAQMMAQVMAA